jgi:hypothetical protein
VLYRARHREMLKQYCRRSHKLAQIARHFRFVPTADNPILPLNLARADRARKREHMCS